MSKEAMKLALEALEANGHDWHIKERKAKEALRQAIEDAEKQKQEQGEPDDEVLGFNGWGFPIQRHSKQKHDDPVVYSKEQMKIIAEANYDAGYTTGYMDSSVKAHDRKTLPVVWIHSDELEELSHCNGMSVWAENAQVHTEDSITNQLIPNGYLPLYTRPQPKQEQGELAATERQVEILTDELANCQRALEKQEQGEPVTQCCSAGIAHDCHAGDGCRIVERIKTVNTTPQQRKPLTDEQIADIVVEMNGNEPPALFWKDLTRAIEAAHGIKE